MIIKSLTTGLVGLAVLSAPALAQLAE